MTHRSRWFSSSLLLLTLAVAACGDDGSTGAADMAAPSADLSKAPSDLATPDLATAPDLTPADDFLVIDEGPPPPDMTTPIDRGVGTGCRSDADCRLYSSYCQMAPCMCIPLRKDSPDPPCAGGMVNCLFDPCMKFKPVCDVLTGMCGMQ